MQQRKWEVGLGWCLERPMEWGGFEGVDGAIKVFWVGSEPFVWSHFAAEMVQLFTKGCWFLVAVQALQSIFWRCG